LLCRRFRKQGFMVEGSLSRVHCQGFIVKGSLSRVHCQGIVVKYQCGQLIHIVSHMICMETDAV